MNFPENCDMVHDAEGMRTEASEAVLLAEKLAIVGTFP
jgi:hypothetical protein